VLLGGAGDDMIMGDAGADEINGGQGDDLLFGGAGADMFIFGNNFGNDIITDFDDVGGGQDEIDLTALSILFDDITITQNGLNSVITIDGVIGSITVENITAANLQQDDFVL
jgi:Ca2+-binding RTX toxin-like protein